MFSMKCEVCTLDSVSVPCSAVYNERRAVKVTANKREVSRHLAGTTCRVGPYGFQLYFCIIYQNQLKKTNIFLSLPTPFYPKN